MHEWCQLIADPGCVVSVTVAKLRKLFTPVTPQYKRIYRNNDVTWLLST